MHNHRKEKMRELERKSQLLLKKAEMDAKRVSDGGDDNASGISAGKVTAGLPPSSPCPRTCCQSTASSFLCLDSPLCLFSVLSSCPFCCIILSYHTSNLNMYVSATLIHHILASQINTTYMLMNAYIHICPIIMLLSISYTCLYLRTMLPSLMLYM